MASPIRADSAIRRPPTIIGAWSWVTSHPVELVFAGLIGGAFAYLLDVTSESFFQGDDWKLILQGGSLGGMFEPYNDHLSVMILGLYRVLVELFGFTYTPIRVAGLVCLMAAPVAYFLVNRRLLGPPLAAAAAGSMLAFSNLELQPAVLNHYLVLVAGIGCSAALNRGPRADWVLAVALVLSLGAAGGGLAVAVACAIHNACTRPPWRRWFVVLGPTALWAVWWLIAGRSATSGLRPTRPTATEALRYAIDIAWSPFQHLALGSTVIALLLLAGFCLHGVRRLRAGWIESANFLAWSAALGVWALGIAYSRGARAITEAASEATDGATPAWAIYWTGFRYQFLALGFALLAVVPVRRTRWPRPLQPVANRKARGAAAIAILALGVGQGIAVHDDVDEAANRLAAHARSTAAELVVLDLGPSVIADDVILVGRFPGLKVGELRALFARHGRAPSSTAATADQQLFDLGAASAPLVFRRDLECDPITEPITWLPTSIRPLYLWSSGGSWTVEVRRFGPDWITMGEFDANQAVALTLPALAADRPWEVKAVGACRRAP